MSKKYFIFFLGFLALVLILLTIYLYPVTTYTYIEKAVSNHYVNSDWENYIKKYNNEAQYDITKMNAEDLIETFGTPYIKFKKTLDRKYSIDIQEIWIYMPYVNGEDVDNTGIYIIFTDGKITDYRVDDFNGILYDDLELYFD